MQPLFSFTFPSRYDKLRTATLLDRKRGIFEVSGEARFVRGGEGMFDFEGGPFYTVGASFHGMGDITSVTPVQGDIGVAKVLVTVELTKGARAKIGREIKKIIKEMGDVRDQANERQGGQGSSCGAPRCCGGVCRQAQRRDGGEVAVGDRQAERIGDGVLHGTVEGIGGDGDGGAGSAEGQVRRLQEDLARGNEQRRAELEAKYPRVFGEGTQGERSDGSVDWEFGYGWDGLIRNLAAAIDAELERNPDLMQGDIPFRIVQMKEKFGSLRIYQDGGNRRIDGLIRMTESLSSGICEVCGEVGFLVRSGSGEGGWYKTMCADCAAKFGYAKGEGNDDK
jgi:hypothetical protein